MAGAETADPPTQTAQPGRLFATPSVATPVVEATQYALVESLNVEVQVFQPCGKAQEAALAPLNRQSFVPGRQSQVSARAVLCSKRLSELLALAGECELLTIPRQAAEIVGHGICILNGVALLIRSGIKVIVASCHVVDGELKERIAILGDTFYTLHSHIASRNGWEGKVFCAAYARSLCIGWFPVLLIVSNTESGIACHTHLASAG